MGCTGSSPDSEEDRAVQKELSAAKKKDNDIKKLLFLGAGGSGKTTLFKQLQYIHGDGFNARDRKQFRLQIYEQIMEYMKIMIRKIEDKDFPCDDEKWLNELDFENETSQFSAKYIADRPNNVELTPEVVGHLRTLWNDKNIRKLFNDYRGRICVADSTGYYLDNLSRLAADDYVPTDADLLLVRYRTTGMTEKQFVIEGNNFLICDVGGQRNERRKWINFFDNVTAVIFVVSLSCYDEVVFEDEDTNCMVESLQVFDETLNLPTFIETAFILFLNKKDVFDEKIKKVPITVCFQDYSGPQTSDDSLAYIRTEFEKKNKNAEDRNLYPHVTQATDRDNITKVFQDVQHIVVQFSLQRSGLV